MSIAQPVIRTTCLAIGFAVVSLPSQAEEEPGVHFTASYQLQHDNNLFRLPPDADPLAVLGASSASDSLQVKSAGVSFDQRYSLQNVHAEISLVDYDFQRFSQYDLTATNYGLDWDWAVTPQLQGRLSAERSESINNFDGTATQMSSGNSRVQTRHGLDLRYDIDSLWRVQGALANSQDRSDQAVVGADDYRQNTVEAGVRRSFGSGSHATARLSRSQGRNLNSSLVADDSYRQTDLGLDLHWVFSGLTTADASVKRLSRSHPAAPGLDYSGVNASGSVKWQATGKLRWTLSGASLLDSSQSVNSTHARTDKIGLSSQWAISANTTLQASIDQTRLRLLGHPSGGITSPRRDRGLETSLTLVWQPDDLLALQTSLKHRKRDSSLPQYDYSSTLYSFGISARF